MREWLTVIIVLLIVGVLLDGWRRMRQARRESIRMSRKIHKGSDRDDPADIFGSELPNGGARVVGKRDVEDTRALTQTMQEKFKQSRTTAGRPRIPQQVALGLEQEMPELLDPIEGDARTTDERGRGRVEPTLSGDATLDDELAADDSRGAALAASDEFATSDAEDAEYRTSRAGSDYADNSDVNDDVNYGDDNYGDDNYSDNYSDNYDIHDEDELDPLFAPVPEAPADNGELDAAAVEPDRQVADADDDDEIEPDEVLVINVMAPRGTKFPGEPLLEVSLECGLRFGDRQIFHRCEQENGEGALLFSMVNMVVPGTFDLTRMADFETPGVSLFMTLPMRANSMQAFNTMAATAHALAQHLGGELKDETRSAMTNQTLEHCRQRILEYERKRQLAGAH